jgi:chromosome segregation ATPase
MIRVALCALFFANAYQIREQGAAVQKVIQLMQDMLAKGRAAKQDEEVKFAAYKQFCEGTTAEKKSNIADAASEIEDLQASIQKAESDAAVLAEDIAGLDEDIAGWTEDMKEATALREKEKADFEKTLRDYEESLDALDRAIVVLKKQSADVPQAMMLLQKVVATKQVPASAKRTIMAYLAMGDTLGADPLSVTAPQAKGYEFQSGGVVDMLENLRDKFQKEKNDLEKDEMGAKHAYDLMMMELKDSISAAESMRATKAKMKAGKEADAATDKGSLADTTASKTEDETYLADLIAQCEQKSNDFASRQQLRAEELEAIQKAIEIISSPEVAGNAGKHLSLIQSFALRASHMSKGKTTAPTVVAYLQGRASNLQSKSLRMLAMQVAETEREMADPFKKVKKMIDSMITKLLEEANEESDKKGWCDKEMAVNGQTREDKTEEVNTLTAEVDKLKADIIKLSEQIADLSTAITEIDGAMVNATDIRLAEKDKNKATIEDAKDAQTAVGQAIAVLKDFYAKSATATALVQGKQTPEEEAPETFDEPYTGMGGASGGVVGLLEVIESDFNKLEAETAAAEDEAAKEYDRFMAESKKDKAVKTADMDYKKKTKTQKESDLSDTTADLKGTEKELQSALFYYEKIKPQCVDAGVSYEERVAKREAEIESLKTALKILSDV